MKMFRLLITGAAVAAGVHYLIRKRSGGTSIAEEISAKVPELMDSAKPYSKKAVEYVVRLKDRLVNEKVITRGETDIDSYYSNPKTIAGIGTL